MTENKNIDALIIIGLIITMIVIAVTAPASPSCINTGKEYTCTSSNYKETN